jgi:cystathionine gamma-synthase
MNKELPVTDQKPATILVREGRPESSGSPLNAPLVPASNFLLGEGLVYSREDTTETWSALEAVVGALEGGHAISFASGMAAAAAVFEQVPAGGRVALPEDCYQGVATLASEGADKGRWTLQRIATDDTDRWLAAAPDHDLLWVESPSNPQLIIADLPAIAAVPRRGLLAVDNTFATPLNQQPLKLGADISMHSVTKYIGGHSDLLGGILVARDPELRAAFRTTRKLTGATPGSLEAWLAARGVRTMALRLERCQQNAAHIAAFLENHPRVRKVLYPGLASHPQHDLAKATLGGFGAVISFEVDGSTADANAVCRNTRLIRHATSLGSVETTMERRAAHGGQEHIPASLLRISVGIEAVEDLEADLEQALGVIGRPG